MMGSSIYRNGCTKMSSIRDLFKAILKGIDVMGGRLEGVRGRKRF